MNKRHNGGAVSGLDVAQQQTVLDSSTPSLALLQQQRAQFEHAMAALQGLPASEFKAPVRALEAQPPAIPVALPSELLQRRPDIATAEREVAAANAQIGVARAAFYPSILAGGRWRCCRAADIANAGECAQRNLVDGIDRAGADHRRRPPHAQLEGASAAYDENVANYRESALVAFQQVEDALSGLNALQSASDSQQRAVADAERSLTLANARYTGGLVTYLDVITAQEQVFDQRAPQPHRSWDNAW